MILCFATAHSSTVQNALAKGVVAKTDHPEELKKAIHDI